MQVVPHSSQRSMVEQRSTCGVCRTCAWRAGCAWRKLWPHGKPKVDQVLTGPVTPWEEHTETDLEELQPCGRDLCWRRVWRIISCGRPLTLEQEKSMRRKEQHRWSVTNWLQPPFHIPLCHFGREEGAEESGTKNWIWAHEERGWDDGGFIFVLICHFPTLILIVSK